MRDATVHETRELTRALAQGWRAYEGIGDSAPALADGWYVVSMKGSHRQLKHPVKPGRVTIVGKPSDDLAPGTLGSILEQSGLKR